MAGYLDGQCWKDAMVGIRAMAANMGWKPEGGIAAFEVKEQMPLERRRGGAAANRSREWRETLSFNR